MKKRRDGAEYGAEYRSVSMGLNFQGALDVLSYRAKQPTHIFPSGAVNTHPSTKKAPSHPPSIRSAITPLQPPPHPIAVPPSCRDPPLGPHNAHPRRPSPHSSSRSPSHHASSRHSNLSRLRKRSDLMPQSGWLSVLALVACAGPCGDGARACKRGGGVISGT
jgi:hypothetical protein